MFFKYMVNLNIPAVTSRKCGFNCLGLCKVEGLSTCCLSNSKYLSQGIYYSIYYYSIYYYSDFKLILLFRSKFYPAPPLWFCN